jgi:ABC-2 type transport system ATP-binding protein
VSAALERVGLAERADDIVRTFSLGMVQRLGLAAALLKDPAVLILDEPANGLDPVGIVEVRDLLRGLAAEGRTVLVASHVLPEIEQACDHVAIFFSGHRVAMGTLAEVRAAAGTGGILVRLAGLDRATEVLRSAGIDSTREGGRLRVGVPATEAARVSKVLAEAGMYVEELQAAEASLEEAFFALTRGEIETGVPT